MAKMVKKKIKVKVKMGTSSAPMILGVLGGVLMVPNAVCSGICGLMTGEGAPVVGALVGGVTGVVMMFGAAALSVIFGCLGKSAPILSGVVMIVTGLYVIGDSWVINLLGLTAGLLTLVGGISALVQSREEV